MKFDNTRFTEDMDLTAEEIISAAVEASRYGEGSEAFDVAETAINALDEAHRCGAIIPSRFCYLFPALCVHYHPNRRLFEPFYRECIAEIIATY